MARHFIQEIERLKKEGPGDDLLNRAKETSRRNYQTALKQNNYWLGRLQTTHMFGQDPAIITTRLDRINALTAQSVQEAFQKYFPTDRSTIVTLLPAKQP